MGMKGKLMMVHTSCLTTDVVGGICSRGTTGLTDIHDGTEDVELINMMFEVFDSRCYSVNVWDA